MNEDALSVNRRFWDALTPIHTASEFYDVSGFRTGKEILPDVQIEELGDVSGRTLLHLQCHFGLDTLSWARRGASVTGVDFSPKAVEQARLLSEELGIAARFVCCELGELPKSLGGQFDIVFTSAGVLAWLPDLRIWAEVIGHFLKAGGVFYMHEFHPMACAMDDETTQLPPRLRYPYFNSPEPMLFPAEEGGTYAEPDKSVKLAHYEWFHGLSEIVGSLMAVGLHIEFFHEFDYSLYQSHPFLSKGADGMWRYQDAPKTLPLMFSIRAIRD